MSGFGKSLTEHIFFSQKLQKLNKIKSSLNVIKEEFEKTFPSQKGELFVNINKVFNDKNPITTYDELIKITKKRSPKTIVTLEEVTAELNLNPKEHLALNQEYTQDIISKLAGEREFSFKNLEKIKYLLLDGVARVNRKYLIQETGLYSNKITINTSKSPMRRIDDRIKQTLDIKYLIKQIEQKNIHDTNGVMVFMDSIEECYRFGQWLDGQGLVNFNYHPTNAPGPLWKVVKNQNKDFLGDKGNENGYKALYRTIKFPIDVSHQTGGISIEIQIMTPRIHKINEDPTLPTNHKLYRHNQIKKICTHFPLMDFSTFHELLKIQEPNYLPL